MAPPSNLLNMGVSISRKDVLKVNVTKGGREREIEREGGREGGREERKRERERGGSEGGR